MNTQRAPRLRSRVGMTLVELIVAAVVLAVGILGLSTTAVVVARMVQVSHLHMSVRAQAQAEIEGMLAGGAARLEAGSKAVDGVVMSWDVNGDDLKELRLIARRRAGRFEVADTLATLVRSR